MVRLLATKSFRYSERSINYGEEFEANSQNAYILVAIGKATRVPKIGKKVIADKDAEIKSTKHKQRSAENKYLSDESK